MYLTDFIMILMNDIINVNLYYHLSSLLCKGVSPELLLPDIQNMGLACTDYYGDGNCGICSGDCDTDEDCAEDLVCYQRETGGVDVPGCSWGENSDWYKYVGRWDYCKLLHHFVTIKMIKLFAFKFLIY